jgi:glutamate-1-semialdehyde 2,1-aminomutase
VTGQPWQFLVAIDFFTVEVLTLVVVGIDVERHRIVGEELAQHTPGRVEHPHMRPTAGTAPSALGSRRDPIPVQSSSGIPAAIRALVRTVPFNDLEGVERLLADEGHRIAAIVVEPIIGNCFSIMPTDGFLESLRDLCDEHGAVLIFDEVKTGVVLAYGGATEHFGIKPDLFCLAKSIGGGVPIGAFGGRGEVMGVIEQLPDASGPTTGVQQTTIPGGATRVAHLGTFNGNPLSMAAGVAVLTRILTRDVYPRLHALAEKLTDGCQKVIDEYQQAREEAHKK